MYAFKAFNSSSLNWFFYDDNHNRTVESRSKEHKGRGNLTRVHRWVDSHLLHVTGLETNPILTPHPNSIITETSEYDEYGNVIETRDGNSYVPQPLARENPDPNNFHPNLFPSDRLPTTQTQYDPEYKTFPVVLTDALGPDYAEEREYYGISGDTSTNQPALKLKSITDANDQTTRYKYDHFSRLTEVWKPFFQEQGATCIDAEFPSIRYIYKENKPQHDNQAIIRIPKHTITQVYEYVCQPSNIYPSYSGFRNLSTNDWEVFGY